MNFPFYWETPFKLLLCFPDLVDELEKQAADPTHECFMRAKSLLAEIEKHPEIRDGITDISQIYENKDLLSRMLETVFPPALTRNEIKAISIPYTGLIFNHTERFRQILRNAGENFDIIIRDFDEHQFYIMNCCLILNEFYGTHLDFSKPLFYDIPTAEGIIKHYRILYNADFLDILPTEKSLALTPEDIDHLMDNYDDIALWKEKFPKESFLLKGYTIMSLFDATIENAVSIFKEKLLGLTSSSLHLRTESILRSIFRLPELEVGLCIYDDEEETFSTDAFGRQAKSFLVQSGVDRKAKEMLNKQAYHHLLEKKTYFAVSKISDFLAANPDSILSKYLYEQKYQSFILAPMVKNRRLFGVLELVSKNAKELNSINANKLDVVMPFLTDSIERVVAEFQNQVEAIIQDHYTTIHRSVYWKFRAVAKKLIYHNQSGISRQADEILFPDVYPLYGQVDIKGSSDVRNLSVQNDLKHQLASLLTLLENINGAHDFVRETERVKQLLAELDLPIMAGTEQYIQNYIDTRIHPQLKQVNEGELSVMVNNYLDETMTENGSFRRNVRMYEDSIRLINEKLAALLDQRQSEAQLIFPHYYERFKTDGVEHNLYIGRSISPTHVFDHRHLQALRLWQIRVLCEMERLHHRLKPSLPFPLDVTTLIMVSGSTIAIRFRMDEKRFDVDGSYNARFEIVKKRIDKARILNSTERITETGKITIVYSNRAEEIEYLGYIRILQEENLLTTEIENLQVEDLQGVSGLKALRVKLVS
ncbi:hypothetical protein [Flavihumibacter solisilvae]|uniref:GAF domain-containing protein n=1 Tax=Flavihumibacter solisilvae TaxID=1349421 RepID=A0A0C1L471_9BACT|nr:hypothetical protein [Flavihumibacter solisilvae]KIC94887.1 hypothetical protein OI18_08220 [Flavihumibacter solisilvae]